MVCEECRVLKVWVKIWVHVIEVVRSEIRLLRHCELLVCELIGIGEIVLLVLVVVFHVCVMVSGLSFSDKFF